MYELINEPIQVFAEFTKKGPRPYLFKWKNRDYKIKTLNFVHTSKQGNKTLFHFSVSTDTNMYKITFDPTTLTWTLDEIHMDIDFNKSFSANDKSTNKYS